MATFKTGSWIVGISYSECQIAVYTVAWQVVPISVYQEYQEVKWQRLHARFHMGRLSSFTKVMSPYLFFGVGTSIQTRVCVIGWRPYNLTLCGTSFPRKNTFWEIIFNKTFNENLRSLHPLWNYLRKFISFMDPLLI